MARFKKLQRKYKESGDVKMVKELAKLDKKIADNNKEWVKTYANYFT